MTYVDQVVTAYRPVWQERDVKGVVNKVVTREVEEVVNYISYEQKVTPEKRKEVVYKQVVREVPYKYTVQVPYMAQEKGKQTVYNCVATQVPYKYTVQIPVVTQEKRTITEYVCVPTEVVQNVTVCHRVPVQVVDCCGCCRTVCQTVTEVRPVKTVVMNRVAQNRDVMVNVCNYRTEERQAAYTKYDTVATEQEVVYNVCKYRNEERAAVRHECSTVAEEREVVVNLVSCVQVSKPTKVKRLVYETVQEAVVYKERYCVQEAYQTTVRVPVPVYAGCAPAPCGH